MSGTSGLGKCIVVFLNVVFMLVALALMACGVALRFFLGAILKNSVLAGTLHGTLDKLFHVQQVPQSVDFGSLSNVAGLSLLIAGGVLFLVSFLAVCGACCCFRPFLALFALLLTLLMLGQITVFALVLIPSSPVHTAARKWMEGQVDSQYGKENEQGFTAAMDLVMYSMQCCGIEGPSDFDRRNLTVNGQHAEVPASCCKRESLQKKAYNCTETQAYAVGCYDKILTTLDAWKPWLIPVFVGLLLFQGVEVVISVVMMRDIGKSSVRPV